MYVLDTNVLSELRRPARAHPAVAAWARSELSASFFLSAITILEIEIGILRIGRRDATTAGMFREWMDTNVLPRFGDRILPIDTSVAVRCASLHVPDPRSERDAFIAATALTHNFTIVTRNTADFAGTGARLVNPWEFRGQPTL
ncbi:MAG: type II toxin-antitoxin system VapC family toxin [Bauldia sp.]|nr:type II toxin-antitoxin system VapC family toxin [Bauldia sp.]MCW5717295.1 type II toxin-antitoxin system VapC family toxin [Bauldia sp.]